MKYEDVVKELKRLNPNAGIMTAEYNMGYRIYSIVHGSKLRLPDGFEYNDKNGITNKHHAVNGQYINIEVEELKEVKDMSKPLDNDIKKNSFGKTIDKNPIIKDVSQSTNIREIVEVIKILNPNVDIRLGNPAVDSEAHNRFYSSVPMDKLILPKGFEYNDKNGITNKHHTHSGLYTCLTAESLATVDHAMLMPEKLKVVRNERPIMSRIQKVKQVAVSAIKKLHNKVQMKRQTKGVGVSVRNR